MALTLRGIAEFIFVKHIFLTGCGVLLMAVGVYAQAPAGAAAQTSPAVATAPSGQDLDALRAQEKTLKTRIALTQDNINTYKSWFGHPLTPAQRIDAQSRLDRAKTMLEGYQKDLAAVQAKIKGVDPTATSTGAVTSGTQDPKWPFKH